MEKRILVVDDEAAIRDIMTCVFTRAGYEVQTAANAEEALALARQQRYPVFFLDLSLPGMDGIELCRHMRKDNPCSIAYAVTGYADPGEGMGGEEWGFEDCFTKPTDLKTLLRAAETAFQKLAHREINEGCV
ncbi:response regulator [Desulforhabdus amnigena]|uniref:Response regulatory domain-containing protein n=1 Tax=Desulforhabdus amnigena TaxID=40218 RepID=A0A9W6FVH7_9BACT|nr:response regulator [Desulforhabdus amnigena]NLJ28909.1 response regulator [Deltaproteobacteria bacterium]GLI35644.1 hypothetical protein DAMNIGENAA_30770 [Desulforhabdus amnigena]